MSTAAVIMIAIGGALFFEGAAWAIFPGGIRRLYAEMMASLDDRDLHISGAISVFLGVALIMWGFKLSA